MAKQIIWSREALVDRLRILDYWYRRTGSKDYPVKLDKEFRAVICLLYDFPELGRKLEDTEERFFIKDYFQIFYLNKKEDAIYVLYIRDTRRNPEDFPL